MKPQTFSLILLTSLITATAQAAIEPARSGTPPTNDPLIPYQWAIWTNGQKATEDIDDIHPRTLEADPRSSMNWSSGLDAGLTRDVIVAVIDSGLDVDHEDLRGAIALNPAECIGGRPPVGEAQDKDGNGFAGDCMGWDFSSRDPRRGRFVLDDAGHGTHISGIIAARSGNKLGITGVSNRIKILPVKVFDSREETGAPTGRKPIHERVAESIDFAVKRGAEVINLSMGWPSASHTAQVQASIDNAIARGVVLVAGAGNDSHDQLIFPCAHPGVICVGATEIDYSVSRFSNFGGQVDVIGPGGQVLSTWPSGRTSNLFGQKGYELRSGTSQATPYVAAAAALLKGKNPKLSPAEVRAILVKTSRPVPGWNGLGGYLDIQAALASADPSGCLPDFKKLDWAKVEQGEFSFKVPVICLGGATLQKAAVTTASGAVVLESVAGAGLLDVRGKVMDPSASALFRFHVQLNGREYGHQLMLVRSISGASKFLIPGDRKNLASAVVYGASADTEFYSSVKLAAGLEVTIYRPSTSGVTVAGSMLLMGVSELQPDLAVVRVDLNGDDRLDYFLGGVVRGEKNEAVAIRYGFFSDELKPLVGMDGAAELHYEGILPSTASLRFARFKDAGGLALPVFMAAGFIPEQDRNKDPFSFEKPERRDRLYYLELETSGGKPMLRTRTLVNGAFPKEVRAKLGLGAKKEVTVLSVLPQSYEAARAGSIRMLISYGNGALQDHVVLELDGDALKSRRLQFKRFDHQGLDLGRQSFMESLVTENGHSSVGTSVVGLFSQTQARVVTVRGDDSGVEKVVPFQARTVFAQVMGLIRTFVSRDGSAAEESVSIFETDTELAAHGTWQGKAVDSSSPLYRSSFLPGQLFSQRFASFWIDRGGKKQPGLFVDNSRLFGPYALAWTLSEDGKLVAPASLTFEVPSNCRPLNPATLDGQAHLALICAVSEASLELRLLRFE